MTHATVKPARTRIPDPDLQTTRLRRYGWRLWRKGEPLSEVFRSYSDAVTASRDETRLR